MSLAMDAACLRWWVAQVRRGNEYPTIDELIALLHVPEWDESLRDAPAVVRVMAFLPTFRAQYHRNGLDGLVWNHRDDAPALIAAFAAIGASSTAGRMRELLTKLQRTHEPIGEPSVVDRFLAWRDVSGGAAFGPWLDFAPLKDAEDALLTYCEAEAAAVVAFCEGFISQSAP